ncbi:MAG: xanthine phosphoribosyltransferase [Clostridia bacterium]|nr:xanthine phosphoribosyltransferase [Clostridia bacterium]
MRELEERILQDGRVLPGNILKVGSFLNQQIDVSLMAKMGREIARLYAGETVTKVLTIESSGIAIAVMAAWELGVPVAVVKKSHAANQSDNVYSAEIKSYTHGNTYTATLEKDYLKASDRVLIVDDFLASGEVINGLQKMIGEAGAVLVGCAVAIEKKFQHGGDTLRQSGVRVESLAMVESMTDTGLTFAEP